MRVTGSFIVVRKMALFGDTLSHVSRCVRWFMWNMSKDPLAIFIGATLAGLIGGALVTLIVQTTRLKEDTAWGWCWPLFCRRLVLTRIQKISTGNKGGLDIFFGQAAVGKNDITLMLGVTLLVIVAIAFFYKELLV